MRHVLPYIVFCLVFTGCSTLTKHSGFKSLDAVSIAVEAGITAYAQTHDSNSSSYDEVKGAYEDYQFVMNAALVVVEQDYSAPPTPMVLLFANELITLLERFSE